MKEKIKEFMKGMFGRNYHELRSEWEEQNETIDILNSNIHKLDKRYKKLVMLSYFQTILYTKVKNENKKLKNEIKNLKEGNKRKVKKGK